jgi:hypothetical protein
VSDRKRKSFTVDRTGLVNYTEEEMTAGVNAVAKEPLSPLGKDLKSYIKLKGPITLHDYMSQSLNHLLHGYYQGKLPKLNEKPRLAQVF